MAFMIKWDATTQLKKAIGMLAGLCVFYRVMSLYSPGAEMGTWKGLRVQGFMIDLDSIGMLKEIMLGCHDGNLGELFLFA